MSEIIRRNSVNKSLEPTDFSMLDTRQIINLCRQRSNRIGRFVPSREEASDSWPSLMEEACVKHRDEILSRVSAELNDIFLAIEPAIERVNPTSLADIGCGQAFIDLLIYRRFGCDLVLIDIEESEDIHFGFAKTGAGYASLDAARQFLVANGVPDRAITTINPKREPKAALPPVDMAISLLSCGFHYPADTYEAYFRTQVRKAILLDCRRGKGGDETLARHGEVSIVHSGRKHDCLLCLKQV